MAHKILPVSLKTVTELLVSSNCADFSLKFDWSELLTGLSSAHIALQDRCSAAFYMNALRGKIAYSGFTDYDRPAAYAKIACRVDAPRGFFGSPKTNSRLQAEIARDLARLPLEFDVFRA